MPINLGHRASIRRQQPGASPAARSRGAVHNWRRRPSVFRERCLEEDARSPGFELFGPRDIPKIPRGAREPHDGGADIGANLAWHLPARRLHGAADGPCGEFVLVAEAEQRCGEWHSSSGGGFWESEQAASETGHRQACCASGIQGCRSIRPKGCHSNRRRERRRGRWGFRRLGERVSQLDADKLSDEGFRRGRAVSVGRSRSANAAARHAGRSIGGGEEAAAAVDWAPRPPAARQQCRGERRSHGLGGGARTRAGRRRRRQQQREQREQQ
mmetsp:Transcript_15119/g.53076  ORF Transcript_15119/g.53076 Transcript_15119/m.53076 type:complete len:271 (-) Transcript_15119:288-1100(-)